MTGSGLLSVIIPVLNEAETLPSLIDTLQAEAGPLEIIIVDGGSSDDTVGIARGFGVRVVKSDRGRGHQLAAGAQLAGGDILLFLHADSVFPPDGLAAIRSHLSESPELLGGNFRLLFDGDRRFDRWLEGFYAWIRRNGLYYGDSGIFIRHDAYRRLGGFRTIALMEDYDLVQRMEAAGATVCIQHPPLLTSSRRFNGRHPIAIFLGWVRIHLLYRLGMSGFRLADLYDSERRRQRTA